MFDWRPSSEANYPHFAQALEFAQRGRALSAEEKRPNHQRADLHDKVNAYGFTSCPKCYQPVLLLFKSSNHNLQVLKQAEPNSPLAQTLFARQYLKLIGTIPSADTHSAPEALPKNIRDLWPATLASLDRGDPPSRIVSECRSVLDVSLKQLGATSGTRAKRIEKLKVEGKITEDIAEWANELWDDGNDAVHDIVADAEAARQHVEFLKLFFRVAFELPSEVAKLKSKKSIAT